jgi:hypothetical protein
MQPGRDGVQFFDFVEEHRGFDHDTASAVAESSGSTAVATAGTSTAASGASGRGVGGRPARREESTGPATKGVPITGTNSAPTEPAGATVAWGIMVPKT